MEPLKDKTNPLNHQLGSISNNVAIPICGSLFIFLVMADYLFGFSLGGANGTNLLLLIGAALLLITFMAFNKLPIKVASIIALIGLHLIVICAFVFVIPLPSPYLIVLIAPGLIVYYTFGIRMVVASTIITGVTVGSQFFVRHELTKEKFGMYMLHCLIANIFLFFVLIFLRIAEEERKALETVTRQTDLERSRLLTLVNNLSDAVIACDSDFKVLLFNPKAQTLLNAEHTLHGKKLDTLMDLRDVDGEPIRLSGLADPGKHVNVHTSYRLFYSRNDSVSLYIAISQVQHGKEAPSGYVILLRDITKLKTLEEERNEFVSIMSHELRTPVSIVEGGISLARAFVKKGSKSEAIEYLEKAHSQSLMLSTIVRSLAMLVNSEKGNEKIKVSEIEPKLVANKILMTYQQEVQDKGLKLVVHNDPSIRTIYTNADYLYEILQNLMTNAIKYTKEGTITISVKQHSATHVAFAVADTGIGMSKSDVNHIFEKFWRSEDFHTRKSGGTGLGLYLTKKLADSIAARIEVESTLGKGSKFIIYIPIYDTQEV